MFRTWCVFAGMMVLPLSSAATQTCGGEPGWASRSFSGTVLAKETYDHEIGLRSFVLNPTEFGWRIGMADQNGMGLHVFAAPIRPVETNPLNIAGWHFRNRDNSGPNTGDVNAPQHQRRFSFGTMAIDPTRQPELITPAVADEGFGGIGVLDITDFTLTPPKSGERAAMISLTFSACLIWQGGGDRLDPIVDADPGVAFETVVATMRGCGLNSDEFKISDRMSKGREGAQRPFLEPDLDGDNIPDLVVPVTRRSDGAAGLALCLIGDETLLLAGYDGRIGRHLDPSYLADADAWMVHSGPVHPSPDEGPPPMIRGDAILLGKEEKSSVLIYLTSERVVSSYWQGD